ncbi:MAG TPA: CoA-transferase [Syntrophomonadaceae bacterium]|nr:CoA-transferase [Syntrophomonadaceae bacterium]
MKNKLISMEEAVKEYTFDGMTFGNGGGLPVGSDCVAFFREMVRQGVKDINSIANCNSQGTNLLAGAGLMKRMEVGFSGLEVYGFANGLKRAVESGKTILEDYSNGTMPLRLMGAALGWPFIPTFANTGGDHQWCCADEPDQYPNTKKIPEIKDPFTGKIMGALKTVQPDGACIHVTMADIYGNAIMLGTEWNRFELARASKKVVLQADCIVDTDCMRQFPNLVRIPDLLVDAVVYWPMGVWPACSVGMYDSDEEHMFMMNKMLKTEEGTQEYIEKYVKSYHTPEEFAAVIGVDKIKALTDTATAFLMDPYRKWIKTDAEIKELMGRR